MTTTTASAWGFSGANGQEWRTGAACRGQDPTSFDVTRKALDRANYEALALCARCPVRAECLDDTLSADKPPKGLVSGGWWWDLGGRPHRRPGDTPDGATGTPQAATTRMRRSRNAITAARAKLADPSLTYKAAACRYSTNFRAVNDAVFITRYAPDLLNAVWDGRQTLSSAFSEASRRRQEAQPPA